MKLKPSDFYSVPMSEAGVRVPLQLKEGAESGEYLIVLGLDSKPYAAAAAKFERRRAIIKAMTDENEQETASFAAAVDFAESLVVGWSFEDPYTPEAAREFFVNSPYLTMQVPVFAMDRSRFLGPGSLISTDGSASVSASEPATQQSSSDDSAASSPSNPST